MPWPDDTARFVAPPSVRPGSISIRSRAESRAHSLYGLLVKASRHSSRRFHCTVPSLPCRNCRSIACVVVPFVAFSSLETPVLIHKLYLRTLFSARTFPPPRVLPAAYAQSIALDNTKGVSVFEIPFVSSFDFEDFGLRP